MMSFQLSRLNVSSYYLSMSLRPATTKSPTQQGDGNLGILRRHPCFYRDSNDNPQDMQSILLPFEEKFTARVIDKMIYSSVIPRSFRWFSGKKQSMVCHAVDYETSCGNIHDVIMYHRPSIEASRQNLSLVVTSSLRYRILHKKFRSARSSPTVLGTTQCLQCATCREHIVGMAQLRS
jgi:hypothetical protein